MKYLIILVLTIALSGCNKLTPAGFWKDFDSDHIVKSTSDQGPWGGRRNITWKNEAGIYSAESIIKFAEGKGWKLSEKMTLDTLLNKNISIKNDDGKTPEIADLAVYGGNTEDDLTFSGCVNGGCSLYVFNSGWTRVTEGETVTAEGYLLINADKTRMTMFHSWGE